MPYRIHGDQNVGNITPKNMDITHNKTKLTVISML
jgi:hypothetical protein